MLRCLIIIYVKAVFDSHEVRQAKLLTYGLFACHLKGRQQPLTYFSHVLMPENVSV